MPGTVTFDPQTSGTVTVEGTKGTVTLDPQTFGTLTCEGPLGQLTIQPQTLGTITIEWSAPSDISAGNLGDIAGHDICGIDIG